MRRAPAARRLWDAVPPLINDGGKTTLQRRMGLVLKLDALTANPEVLAETIRSVRDHLVAFSPDLAVVQRPV